jgi:hypothetical protein
MGPKGPSLSSQEPITGPYHERDELSPHHDTPFSINHFSSILPFMHTSLMLSLPLGFLTNILYVFLISVYHASFDHQNDIW